MSVLPELCGALLAVAAFVTCLVSLFIPAWTSRDGAAENSTQIYSNPFETCSTHATNEKTCTGYWAWSEGDIAAYLRISQGLLFGGLIFWGLFYAIAGVSCVKAVSRPARKSIVAFGPLFGAACFLAGTIVFAVNNVNYGEHTNDLAAGFICACTGSCVAMLGSIVVVCTCSRRDNSYEGF